MSALRQKAVVGELARYTVELYPDGAGALGPDWVVLPLQLCSDALQANTTNTISDLPVSGLRRRIYPSNLSQIIPVPVLS